MHLSPFQKEKFEYYFKLLDSDDNGYLDMKDLDGFMKKVLDYTKWNQSSQKAKECLEVHTCLYETLLEKANEGVQGRVNIARWLEVWGTMIPGCMSMSNFPIWVSLLPKCLFKIIDNKADGTIDQEELSEFYTNFVGIPSDNVSSLSQHAWNQMTDRGRYPLTSDSYDQMFANFLIGETPYGPGRFIFGCFEHAQERASFWLKRRPQKYLRLELLDPHKQWTVHYPLTPTPIIKVKYFKSG